MAENHRPNSATRAWRWLISNSSRRDRLRDALAVFEVRLAEYKTLGANDDVAWVEASNTCVEMVREAIQDSDLDRGWAFLHEAERHEVDGLAGEALIARATGVRAEAASKLSDWRKDSAVAILDLSNALKPTPAEKGRRKKDPDPADRADAMVRARLKEALRIRDEHFFNVYRKTAIRGEQLVVTAFILAGVLVAVVAFADNDPTGILGTRDALLRSMIYGVLGAVISTAVSLAEDKMSTRRIPEHLAFTYVTLARPFFGAGFAVAAYIAMRSGAVSVFEGKPGGLALGCFLAGFSERWFLGIFDSAVSKKGT